MKDKEYMVFPLYSLFFGGSPVFTGLTCEQLFFRMSLLSFYDLILKSGISVLVMAENDLEFKSESN